MNCGNERIFTMRYSLLGTLFLILLGVSSPAWAALFWEENFENGLYNWDLSGCQNGGNPPANPATGCNPGISATRAISPSKSLKSTFNYTNPELQWGTYYDRAFPNSQDVWVRMWMRFEGPNGSGPFTPSAIQTKHFILYGGGPGLGAWVVYQWGTKNLAMYIVNYPSLDESVVEYSNIALNDYQWYCVEEHFNRGTQGQTNGQLELYVDGTRVYNKQGVVFDNLPDVCPPGSTCAGQAIVRAFRGIRVFVQYGMGDRYYDDIAVGNTRIGCTPGQGGGGSPPDTTAPKTPINLKVSWLWELLDDAAEACANLLAWIAPAEAHATPVTLDRKD